MAAWASVNSDGGPATPISCRHSPNWLVAGLEPAPTMMAATTEPTTFETEIEVFQFSPITVVDLGLSSRVRGTRLNALPMRA